MLSGCDVNSPIRYRYRRAKQSLVACDLLCVHVEVPFATQSRVIGGPEQAVGVHCGTSDRPTAELATVHVSVRRYRCVATQPVSWPTSYRCVVDIANFQALVRPH
ncbi:hypothetical protein ACL69V_004710, partial [Salmonella enterica]